MVEDTVVEHRARDDMGRLVYFAHVPCRGRPSPGSRPLVGAEKPRAASRGPASGPASPAQARRAGRQPPGSTWGPKMGLSRLTSDDFARALGFI